MKLISELSILLRFFKSGKRGFRGFFPNSIPFCLWCKSKWLLSIAIINDKGRQSQATLTGERNLKAKSQSPRNQNPVLAPANFFARENLPVTSQRGTFRNFGFCPTFLKTGKQGLGLLLQRNVTLTTTGCRCHY